MCLTPVINLYLFVMDKTNSDGLFTPHRNVTQGGTGEWDWHNREQWVLVSLLVSDQCEYLFMVLYFPFGPCTSHSPVPVLCEYTTNLNICSVRRGAACEP